MRLVPEPIEGVAARDGRHHPRPQAAQKPPFQPDFHPISIVFLYRKRVENSGKPWKKPHFSASKAYPSAQKARKATARPQSAILTVHGPEEPYRAAERHLRWLEVQREPLAAHVLVAGQAALHAALVASR